jgi:3-oxoacyl-[acyl-carrier protein] reductase
MDLGLKNKTAIVMASSDGLGKAIATEFAREGANVMLFSSSEEKLKKAQADIEALTGLKPAYFAGDLRKPLDIKGLVDYTIQTYGSVYALVNNAGGPPAGTFDQLDDDAWQNAFELTLLSYVRAIREVLPYMRAAGGGRILNSTSSSVKQVLDNLILSNTLRTGVVGLSKSLSQELGADGILVNVIGPGRIGTSRIAYLDQVRATQKKITVEEVKAEAFKTIALGRYGTPDEYGKLAVFLCSEANTYITGQTVLVDGGLTKAF